MIEREELHTERLLLRPFGETDAGDVQRLAGDPDISKTTLHVPYPYEDGMAEAWISTHGEAAAAGTNVVYASVRAEDDALVGSINCAIDSRHRRGELGYWVGKPFWGQGYGTEAASALLDFCFERLNLNRVHAHYLAGNPGSGRVMEKIGMQYEGTLREHIEKDGKLFDLVVYGILRSEWEKIKGGNHTSAALGAGDGH
jgi:[ribosomal protein S5]-alanine N-acetyltransferase